MEEPQEFSIGGFAEIPDSVISRLSLLSVVLRQGTARPSKILAAFVQEGRTRKV